MAKKLCLDNSLEMFWKTNEYSAGAIMHRNLEVVELPAFPSSRLREALNTGLKKTQPSMSDHYSVLKDQKTETDGKDTKPLIIPTKIEVKLSKSSEKKLFKLGCYLSRRNRKNELKKKREQINAKQKKLRNTVEVQQNCGIVRDYLKHQTEDIKTRMVFNRYCDRSGLPAQFCFFKDLNCTWRVEKKDLSRSYEEENKFEILKKEKSGNLEDAKMSIQKNMFIAIKKKSYKNGKLNKLSKEEKEVMRCDSTVDDENKSIVKRDQINATPEKEIVPTEFEKKKYVGDGANTKKDRIVTRRVVKVKDKIIQTGRSLQWLIKNYRRLQEENKSLSESLSCVMANFNIGYLPGNIAGIPSQSCCLPPEIHSSSIPINNLNKVFGKEEYGKYIA